MGYFMGRSAKKCFLYKLPASRKLRSIKLYVMQRTIDSYNDEIMSGLGAISEKNQFFFSAWCCQHLYKQYGKFIAEKLSKEDAEDVTIVLDYIWEQVDDLDNVDEDELESNIETIQDKDPDGDL